MKYRVKAYKPQSFIVCLALSLFFCLFGVGMGIMLSKYDSLSEMFYEQGMALIGGVFFGGVGTLLLGTAFLPPKKLKGYLKEIKQFEGKNMLVFIEYQYTKDGNTGAGWTHSCFIDDISELKEGEFYNIYVKEFNHEIKYIEKTLDENLDYGKSTLEQGLDFTILFMGLFMVFMLAMCIAGLIFYPKYAIVYILVGIVPLYVIIRLSRMYRGR